MSKKQSTAKGFTILSIAGIINKFLALAYMVALTQIVHNDGNGLISGGYSIYLFIFAITNAGIPVAIAKLVSEQTAYGNIKNPKKIFKTALVAMIIIGTFFCVLMATQAKLLSRLIGMPNASLMLIALAPALIFTSISSSIRGYFQGTSNMIPTAISQIIEQFINSVLTVVFAALFIKYGIAVAAAGTTLGTSLGAFGAALFLICAYVKDKRSFNSDNASKINVNSANSVKRSASDTSAIYTVPNSKKRDHKNSELSYKKILQRLAIYGIPLVLGTVVLNAGSFVDAFMVKNRLMVAFASYHNTDTLAKSMYGILTNQYQKLLNLPLAITAALPAALIPAISSASASNDVKLLSRKVNESFRLIFIIMIPAAVGLCVLAKPVITFVFLLKYNQGYDLMQLGSWVIIILAISSIQTAILTGIGKPYIAPINMILGLAAKIAISYVLIAIPSINVKGAIAGTSIGYLIACCLNGLAIKRYVKAPEKDNIQIHKPIIASIGMGAIAFGTFELFNFILINLTHIKIVSNDIAVLFAIFTGVTSYGLFLIILGAISHNDIKQLPKANMVLKIISKWDFINSKLK